MQTNPYEYSDDPELDDTSDGELRADMLAEARADAQAARFDRLY